MTVQQLDRVDAYERVAVAAGGGITFTDDPSPNGPVVHVTLHRPGRHIVTIDISPAGEVEVIA